MEPKKNPRKDVHRYSRQLFLLSLGIRMALVIVAFEWTTEFVPINHDPGPKPEPDDAFALTYIPITAQVPDVPKPPKTVRTIDIVKIEEITDQSTESEEPILEEPVASDEVTQIVVPEIKPEIAPDLPFHRVEEMPEPEGGYEKFYEVLRKNIRYPRVAVRSGTEGYVTVQFIVNESGQLTDMKILKKLGAGCDEEAMRVIALTKWKPGKQRGKPVKVYMVQPVFFALH